MEVTKSVRINKYYEALVNRDKSFIGIFYVGVKTTGIFCIATCRARKPKKQNVIFYTESQELLQHGYRPCKICRPTENAHSPGPEIIQALDLLKSNAHEKITSYSLKQKGLNPDKINRWFKLHHGISFASYQRMLRINNAFQELKNGKNITDTAFKSGYDSLSGFGYTFKTLTGKSPNKAKDKSIIHLKRINTPLGPMFAGADEKGICLFEFTDRRMLETEFRDLQKRLNAVILPGTNNHIKQLEKEMKAYFSGKLKIFKVPLHMPSTDFQQHAWSELKSIPYGTTRSYQEQAENIGKPKAVRAVANANGCNRISIVIPCHRVIGKNGKLTGYGGGLERKQWLLDHEIKHSNK